jgi:hypothetical protein
MTDVVGDDALFGVGTGGAFLAARWRDEGMAQAIERADDWWRRTVEDGIRHLAEERRPFDSDELRELLPDPGPGTSLNTIGACFGAAAKRGLIIHLGYRKSRRPESRRRPVSVWVGVGEVSSGPMSAGVSEP